MMQAGLHRAQHYLSVIMRFIDEAGKRNASVKPLWSQTIVHAIVEDEDFSSKVPMPIVIEPREDHELEETFDFECALMLYNYGLSLSVKVKFAALVQCKLPFIKTHCAFLNLLKPSWPKWMNKKVTNLPTSAKKSCF